MFLKTVSIIVPLNNKGPYIAETIESVLSQSYTNWELVVVENGSIDDGPMVATIFGETTRGFVGMDISKAGARDSTQFCSNIQSVSGYCFWMLMICWK